MDKLKKKERQVIERGVSEDVVGEAKIKRSHSTLSDYVKISV